MRRSQVQNQVRKVTVEFHDDSGKVVDKLNVWYDRAAYTPEFEDASQLDPTDEATTKILAKQLSGLITDWEYLEDKENESDPDVKIPHDYDTLVKEPVYFLAIVMRAIAGDIFPKTPRSKASGSFS